MDLSRFREAVRGRGRPSVPPRAVAPPRELVYVPVDADGYPVEARREAAPGSIVDAAVPDSLHDAEHVSTRYGTCVVISRDYLADAAHGAVRMAELAIQPDETFDVLASRALTTERVERVLYVDLETTGLSGGAGTVPFLVGCAWCDAHGFHLRQVFLPEFSAERAMLSVVADLVSKADCLVTFNGKTFDLPVMESRGAFHRVPVPLCDLPHLDLLHPARRLWRSVSVEGDQSCRLVALEQALLGVAREGDVPGWEIPGRYFHFIRGGHASVLEPVFHHNRFDLLSLAALTLRAQRLVHAGLPATRSVGEQIGLARIYERAGRLKEAETCFRAAAADHAADCGTRQTAWRAVALLCRRDKRHGDAADAWEQALELDEWAGRFSGEAREALAIHHEHRVRDLDAALRHALQALGTAEGAARRLALTRRLARLERKIARQTAQPAGRFLEF